MQQIVDYITLAIASVAGLIIVYGVVLGLVELVHTEWHRFKPKMATEDEKSTGFEKIHYDIGFHLILGLEFLIAADIVRTVVRPSLQELAILGGIVAIRTVLSFFLGREISRQR